MLQRLAVVCAGAIVIGAKERGCRNLTATRHLHFQRTFCLHLKIIKTNGEIPLCEFTCQFKNSLLLFFFVKTKLEETRGYRELNRIKNSKFIILSRARTIRECSTSRFVEAAGFGNGNDGSAPRSFFFLSFFIEHKRIVDDGIFPNGSRRVGNSKERPVLPLPHRLSSTLVDFRLRRARSQKMQ